MKRILRIAFVIALITLVLGCATATPVQRGAAGGAAVGAIAGQLIGGSTEATLIGAGVGALGGAMYNDYKYNR